MTTIEARQVPGHITVPTTVRPAWVNRGETPADKRVPGEGLGTVQGTGNDDGGAVGIIARRRILRGGRDGHRIGDELLRVLDRTHIEAQAQQIHDRIMSSRVPGRRSGRPC